MNKFQALIVATGLLFGLAAISLSQDAGPQKGGKNAMTKGQAGFPGEGKAGQGQGGQRRGMGWEARQKLHQEILAKLNLNAEQKKKIAELDKKLAADAKKLGPPQRPSGPTPGQNQQGAERRKMMDGYRTALSKILTAEQNKKYRDLMMEKMKEMRERAGARKGAAQGKGKTA